MSEADCISHTMLSPLSSEERALVLYLAERRELGQTRVPATQIEQDLHISANKQNNRVRDIVRSINFKGVPIVSTSRGFMFPILWEEVEEFRDSLIGRAQEIWSRAVVIDQCLPPHKQSVVA